MLIRIFMRLLLERRLPELRREPLRRLPQIRFVKLFGSSLGYTVWKLISSPMSQYFVERPTVRSWTSWEKVLLRFVKNKCCGRRSSIFLCQYSVFEHWSRTMYRMVCFCRRSPLSSVSMENSVVLLKPSSSKTFHYFILFVHALQIGHAYFVCFGHSCIYSREHNRQHN